jgi:hypothetical protein
MTKRAQWLGIVALAVGLAGWAVWPRQGKGSVDARVAEIEHRLTTTCSCHPRRIQGLPIEGAIQADLRRWVLEGKDDDTILWLAFSRYGTALLTAGIQNLQVEVVYAGGTVAIILAAGFAALVANLRRSPRKCEARRASEPIGECPDSEIR